jgi:hypothetical protein
MILNVETIDAYQELLTNPAKNKLHFKPIKECFEKSEIVTAKHTLAEQFIEYVEKPLPKLILYIIMDQVFGLCDGKDEDGNLGYHLKFKPE